MASQAAPGASAPVPPHRVGRLRFEFAGDDPEALMRLRAHCTGGADGWVPAALDAALGAVDRPGRTLWLDRLEVDLGVLPDGRLTPEALAAAIRAAIGGAVGPRDGTAPAARPRAGWRDGPGAQDLAQAFAYFLATGRLPWWSPAPDLPRLEAAVLALAPADLRALAAAAAPELARPRGARRLAVQVAPPVARAVALALPVAAAAEAFGAARPGHRGGPEAREIAAAVRAAARASWAEAADHRGDRLPGPVEPGRPPASAAPPAAAHRSDAPSRRDGRPEGADPPLDAASVASAGVVIAHPFLAELFRSRGLLADSRFVSQAAREHAVHLVGHLASGAEKAPEPELVVPKLLAGWPLEAPVRRAPRLSAADRAEAAALLVALIGHWSVLGRTSPAALRETFLARPGRLWEDDRGWRLEVERRGPDVLLGRLPWTLSILRAPWRAKPILVDWA